MLNVFSGTHTFLFVEKKIRRIYAGSPNIISDAKT